MNLNRKSFRPLGRLRFLSPALALTFAAAGLALLACDEHDHDPGAAPDEGAHIHGVARMDVAADGATALLQLRAPAASIYGFEHEPRNDEERATRDAALETLRNKTADWLIAPEGCAVETVEVGLHHEGDGHSHGEPGHDHGHDEEGHKDLHGEWRLSCEADLAGQSLEFKMGAAFDSLETLYVQTLSDATQAETALARGTGKVQL